MSERVVWFSIRRPFRHVLGLGLYLMHGDDRSVGMILLLGPWALVLGPHHTGEGTPTKQEPTEATCAVGVA